MAFLTSVSVGLGFLARRALADRIIPGGAVAALHGRVIDEGLLQSVQFLRLGHPFDREDLMAIGLQSKDEAGIHGLSVQKNRARSAVS